MPDLDKIIHERARLLILTHLASNEDTEVSFNDIQNKLDFSSGNLSVQLRKLADANYLKIHKTYKDNKPYTTVMITASGAAALKAYLEEMEQIIKSLKK
ncbi:hypothetical protein D1BOALGB6SA_4021 [Olavius sp. associated proteobacterium Delta 1]|nr:hypothetical protein D1BOALGB6SA_4021 [Olavius sp. associated proteobacterium Delta 1]